MTKLEFFCECGQRLIDPGIAVENDHLKQALEEKDDDKVRKILDEEF